MGVSLCVFAPLCMCNCVLLYVCPCVHMSVCTWDSASVSLEPKGCTSKDRDDCSGQGPVYQEQAAPSSTWTPEPHLQQSAYLPTQPTPLGFSSKSWGQLQR